MLSVKCRTIDQPADLDSFEIYFTKINLNKMRKIVFIRNTLSSIRYFLIKIESLIFGTSSSMVKEMKLYYTSWKNKLFELMIG